MVLKVVTAITILELHGKLLIMAIYLRVPIEAPEFL
jgi:hypothetical protein